MGSVTHDPDPLLLRAVLETTPDAVVTIDADGCVTGWNPAAAALFGWPEGEVAGRSLAELIVPPELREAHTQGLRRYVETRVSRVAGHPMTLTALRRDATRLPVQLTIWPSESDDGVRFHAFLREAPAPGTDRAELELTRAQYLRLAASAPGASFSHVVDVRGVGSTAFVAGGADLLLGLGAAGAEDLELLVHPDDRPDFGVALDASRGDLTPLAWEGRLLLDGTVRSVVVSATPAVHEDGSTQWDGLLIDVTAEGTAEQVVIEQARRSELLVLALEAVVGATDGAVAVCDVHGTLVAANAAARAMIGADAATLPAEHLVTATPLRDLAGEVLGFVVRP